MMSTKRLRIFDSITGIFEGYKIVIIIIKYLYSASKVERRLTRITLRLIKYFFMISDGSAFQSVGAAMEKDLAP